MRLVLIRHGIAIDREDPGCPTEAERFLTKDGLVRTRQAMRGLREIGLKPELILTSPYVRAAQTAKIAAEVLGIEETLIRSTDALLPGAEPARLLAEIGRLKAREIACCGHAPNLDEVVACAVGARAAFTALKKAGAACLELAAARPGRGTLLWLHPAGVLRDLGE